jgi:hypothetical protein
MLYCLVMLRLDFLFPVYMHIVVKLFLYWYNVKKAYSQHSQHEGKTTRFNILGMLCLRSEDCVANLMEIKVLYVQQDLRYEISSYWRFNV